MAWMWWLLAPFISTVAGAAVLWLRAHRDARREAGGGRASIERHHALLDTLAARHRPVAMPSTMIPLPDLGDGRPVNG
jgi:hypothetical protein